MVAGAVGLPHARSIRSVRRGWPCVLVVLGLAGCGGGSSRHVQRPPAAPLPAAPISARTLTLSGRIVIVNGWQGRVSGLHVRVAAGRYTRGGGGVALVSDSTGLRREVRAPRGEGALRVLRRVGRRLALRSQKGTRFTLDLRTLALQGPVACPSGALPARLPGLSMHERRFVLRPLPRPRSDRFAILLAIFAAAGGRVERVDAAPARHAPCGLRDRSLAARIWVGTPGPIVGILR
jgi:hypothetical protein